MWTLFLYTGHGLDNFRANVPDNIVVFANGTHDEARKSFIENVGKEPELMGFQYTEGPSKEEAWQKAIDSSLMSDEIELSMAMALDGTLVIEEEKEEEHGEN
ncbi:MAG: hypothetical protein ACXADB_03080 [Candidatus Hermodarchaeia archaeon]|jgi:hypothetical protein